MEENAKELSLEQIKVYKGLIETPDQKAAVEIYKKAAEKDLKQNSICDIEETQASTHV